MQVPDDDRGLKIPSLGAGRQPSTRRRPCDAGSAEVLDEHSPVNSQPQGLISFTPIAHDRGRSVQAIGQGDYEVTAPQRDVGELLETGDGRVRRRGAPGEGDREEGCPGHPACNRHAVPT